MQGLGSKAAGGDRAAPSEQEMEILEESSDDGQESEEEDLEEGLDPDEDRRCDPHWLEWLILIESLSSPFCFQPNGVQLNLVHATCMLHAGCWMLLRSGSRMGVMDRGCCLWVCRAEVFGESFLNNSGLPKTRCT